jgi:hypothetical protein
MRQIEPTVAGAVLTMGDLANPELLPPTLSFEATYTALGYHRTSAYAAARANRFPVPIIGAPGPGKWRCPTAAVLKLLGAG